MSEWTIGAVRQSLSDGAGARIWEVPGWVQGDFGIDYRTYVGRKDCDDNSGPCYALTYLPSGLLMGCFCSTLSEVQAFAETIAAALVGKSFPVMTGRDVQTPAVMNEAVFNAQKLHQLHVVDSYRSVGSPRFDRWLMEERAQ